jgi:hypothetical protein
MNLAVLIAFRGVNGNLTSMRSEPFPSLAQLREESIEKWGDSYPDEASAFLDACQNGEYKNEDADLHSLGEKLTDVELASLFLPICRGLVAGCVDHREGPSLEVIMRCYALLDLWQRGELEAFDGLLSHLEEVREMVGSALMEEKSLWWFQIWENMRILEYGVRSRLGQSPLYLYSKYSNIEARLG